MMSIDWGAFALVFATSVAAAALVVTLFATGIRFWSTPAKGSAAGGAARDEETDDVPSARPASATAVGVAVFALSAVVVLVGVWLIVT